MRIQPFSFFERLILYAILAQVFSRVVLEFGLGIWWFKTVQTKLWLMYGLLLADHAFWFLRGGARKLPADWLFLSTVMLFLLISAHGFLVGFATGQGLWRNIEDTAPLIFIAASLFRMQDERTWDHQYTFQRLLWVVAASAWICILFGYLGVLRGVPTKVPPQGAVIAIYAALYLAVVALQRPRFSLLIHSLLFGGALFFSLEDLNRTTLAFLALGGCAAVALRLKVDKAGTILIASALALLPVLAPTLVPAGSKTEARLVAVFDPEARAESISLQSREMEAAEIDATLAAAGPFAQTFGLGNGAGYDFRIPGKFEEDHGHAHYAFAYFSLRYGYVGVVYVVIIGGLLALSMVYGLRFGGPIGYFGTLMSLACLIYLFTYVNFFMYQVALPFVCLLAPVRAKPAGISRARTTGFPDAVGAVPSSRSVLFDR